MNLHPNAKTTPASRELLIQRVIGEGLPVAVTADGLGISPRTAYKWLTRYREGGVDGLRDRSSAPRRMPTATPPRIVKRIEVLRRRRWSSFRIAERLRMAISTVSLILKRLGLSRLSNLDPKPKPIRYERARPGELLHVDIKKLGRIVRVGHRIHGDRRTRVRGAGWEYVHVCVDDCSRASYVEILQDERGASAAPFLRRAVAWFRSQGVHVERVMTDNGSAYISKDHRKACQNLQIRHLRTRPYTPKTNGKAERFIQTLIREWAYARPYRNSKTRAKALRPWLEKYNHRRPHHGIGRLTPIAKLEATR
ncbi:MAG: IS481 family transposase [bacterium]